MNKTKLMKATIVPFSIIAISSFASFIPSITNKTNTIAQKQATKVLTVQPETLKGWNDANIDEIANLPEFDARKYGIVTSIKDQGAQGLCWAYAMSATAESTVLKDGYQAPFTDVRFGPNQLDYVTWHRTAEFDPLGLNNQDHWGGQSNVGALPVNATDAMQMWTAPVDAKEFGNTREYHRASYLMEGSEVVETGPGYSKEKEMTIKKLVAKYGAITIDFKVPRSEPTYINTNTSTDGEHAVVIVGWDDNIPKDSYYPVAETNGGWIIKNSWGESRGKNGYYYMSYDSKIGAAIGLTLAQPTKYQNNYYYDAKTTDAGNPWNMNDKDEAAAVFPVKRASYNKREFLKAINVGVQGRDVNIEANIYKNVNVDFNNPKADTNNPVGTTPVATLKKHIDYPGYTTLELEKPIELMHGENFSVVVKLSNKTNDVDFYTSSDKSTNNMTFYKTNVNTWSNMMKAVLNGAFRIKAFTTEQDIPGGKPNGDVKYATVKLNKDTIRYGEEKPTVQSVTLDGETLREGTDFTVSYGKQNIGEPDEYKDDAIIGNGTITINGQGKFNGTISTTYDIMYGLHPPLQGYAQYDGDTVVFKVGSSISNYNQISKPNTWNFTNPNGSINEPSSITYVGEDSAGYRHHTFPVRIDRDVTNTNKDLAGASITIIDPNSYEYTGVAITPKFSVTLEGQPLHQNTDYTVSCTENTNAGQATLTITAKNGSNYKGSKSQVFTIKPSVNTVSNITLNSANEPYATARFGGPITYKYYRDQACNQWVSDYKPNENGKFWVKAQSQATSNYAYALSPNAVMINNVLPADRINIDTFSDNFKINDSNLTYNGQNQIPTISASYDNKPLTQGRDYAVRYDNNINAGNNTAKAYITGLDKYTGEITKTFSIKKAQEVILSVGAEKNKVKVTVRFNAQYTIEYYQDKSYTQRISAPSTSGEYYVKVIVKGTDNYEGQIVQKPVFLNFGDSPAPGGNNVTTNSDFQSKTIIIIAGSVGGSIALIAIVALVLRTRV